MKILYQLAIIFALAQTFATAEDGVESNAVEDCDNGPDGLAFIGAVRTCIESPEFSGKRCFFTYVPECAGEDVPLVFDLHGHASCPVFSFFYTGWKQLADQHCFVLVYPIGTTDASVTDNMCWGVPGGLTDEGKISESCCCFKDDTPVEVNDGAFLRQVAAVTVRDVPAATSNGVTIDTKRIYIAGHSNGCLASISMGATNSDMVAAVGCHAGTATTTFPETYIPRPMVFVHGTADVDVPFQGNDMFFGLEQVLKIVSDRNGCDLTFQDASEEINYKGTINTFRNYSYPDGCSANVHLYVLDNVGHFPYKLAEAIDLVETGTTPTRVDTTELVWDFVSQHSLDEAPALIVTAPSSSMPTTSSSSMPTTSSSSMPTTSSSSMPTTVTGAPSQAPSSSMPTITSASMRPNVSIITMVVMAIAAAFLFAKV